MSDLWINSWTRSIDGSWIVCRGVIVPSVGMIRSSPQGNGRSVDPREENASDFPAYLGSSNLKVSDRIPEDDTIDEDEGEARFGATSEFRPLKNSASTKSRLIGKSGYCLVLDTPDGINFWYTLGICGYPRRFETFYRN